MTEQYAKLSLRAGFLAAAIESELHSKGEVIAHIRRIAWKLTPEIIDAMKETAIREGASPEVLELAEQEAAQLMQDRRAVERMMEFQAVVDERFDDRRPE